MKANGRGRGRLATITAAATVFAAIVLLLLTGVPLAAPPPAHQERAGSGQFETFAIATTTIYLNRSQSAGTYVSEYVELNNSSTLTKLPVTLTVVASSCRWVVVVNATEATSPVSVFHNVQFHNVTTANGTGTTTKLGFGFKVCGGSAVWLNYQYWTFGVYVFSATGLTVSTVAKVTFGDYPGTTDTAPAENLTFNSTHAISLTVASNLSFAIVFPTAVSGATTCDVTGQICSYPTAAFVSAALAGSSTVNTTGKIQYGTIGSVTGYSLVSAAYANWTVGYRSGTTSANSAVGGFFVNADGYFMSYVYDLWYLWVLIVLVAIVILLVSGRRRRR